MSFCINCGTQLADGSKFCINCGAQQPEAQAAPVVEPAPAPVFDPFAAAPQVAPVAEPTPVVEPAPAPVFDPFAAAPQVAPVAEPTPVVEPAPAPAPVFDPFAAAPQVAPAVEPAAQAPVQPAAPVVDPATGQPVPPKKKKNLGLILGASIGGAVALLTIAIIVVVLIVTRKTEVDLSKYITVQVEGYDESGRIVSYDIDKAKMLKDIMKDKGVKNVDKLKRSDIPDEVYNTVNSIYISAVDLSGSGTFKNGDTIEFDIYYPKYDLDDAKLKFKNESFEYTIKGLEPLKEYDIFAGVEVTFEGMDGDAYFRYKVVSEDDIYDNVYFDYTYSSDLSNGDKVTLSVYPYSGDQNGSYYGYKFTSVSKEYTVEGLSKYVTSIDDLSSDNIKDLTDIAKELIVEEYEDDDDVALSKISYIGSYFAVDDYDYNCFMYAIFTATISSNEDEFEPQTIYLPVQLKYLVLDGDGDMVTDNVNAYMKGSFYVADTWNYVRGYDDPYEMYEDLIDDYSYSYEFEESEGLPDFSERPEVEEPSTDDEADDTTGDDTTDEEDDSDGSLGMGGDEEDAA